MDLDFSGKFAQYDVMTEIGIDPSLLEPRFSSDLSSKLIDKIRADILPEMSRSNQKDLVKKGVEDVSVVMPPQRNPFQSLRPVRCSDKSGNYEPHSVIYTNDFISVVRSTK